MAGVQQELHPSAAGSEISHPSPWDGSWQPNQLLLWVLHSRSGAVEFGRGVPEPSYMGARVGERSCMLRAKGC